VQIWVCLGKLRTVDICFRKDYIVCIAMNSISATGNLALVMGYFTQFKASWEIYVRMTDCLWTAWDCIGRPFSRNPPGRQIQVSSTLSVHKKCPKLCLRYTFILFWFVLRKKRRFSNSVRSSYVRNIVARSKYSACVSRLESSVILARVYYSHRNNCSVIWM
jgi:hypothetical protein